MSYLSVQFSCSFEADSLWPHGLQHTWLPCPSPTPGVHPNPCPLSWSCHPTISISVVPFSCPQSFLASGSFQMSQIFASGGQNIGASASALPMSIQGWLPLGLTGLISMLPNGLARVFSKSQFKSFSIQPSLWSSSHIRTWLLERPQLWLCEPLLAKWCLCFFILCLDLS